MKMESNSPTEKNAPVQFMRGSRAFRQFKNPPQPHMCIQDTVRNTTEKLYINVLGWQKIANPKQYSDPIPLYGGMQVPQGCGLNSAKPPLLVFAVMVNPDILKANGKNAVNPMDRDALVSLLCDFVEAMNPGLFLTRNPAILKDRDLAGELKDVWLAVQNKREREKGMSQDVMYKVYDIDGIGNDELTEEDGNNCGENPDNSVNLSEQNYIQNKENDKKSIKSSRQILMNAGQKSEFDSGMNNCQLNQTITTKDNANLVTTTGNTTYCTPLYGQIVSSRENHSQIKDIQQNLSSQESSKPNNIYNNDATVPKQRFYKNEISANRSEFNNGQGSYDFFPNSDNKTEQESSNEKGGGDKVTGVMDTSAEDTKILIEPMQKLVLQTTDNKTCDNKANALSSISS